jgi:DNA-binding transcriptional MerR regulator
METYSIAQVETLTGIHAHTLRIWEKRYGFIIPERTDTKIRYYSDAQLKTLLNVSVLLDAGYKISKLAKMPDPQLQEVSLEIQSSSTSDHTDIKALVMSMIEFDEARFQEIYQVSVIRRGLLQTIVSIIYPFLHQVGALWGADRVLPAQEHFISNLIRRKLYAAIENLADTKTKGKKVILFLPEHEEHEIGLLVAYFIFKNAGWQTYYLGTNVPMENIAHMEKTVHPDKLCTLLISPVNDPVKRFDHILAHIKTELIVSGNPNLLPQKSVPDRFKMLNSPDELVTYIRNQK